MQNNKNSKNSILVLNNLEQVGPLLALVILMVVLSIASDAFFSVNNLFNIIQQSSMNIIIALGMTVVIIAAGIDLSVGSNLALSGCVMAVAATQFGFPPVLALGTGIVVGTGVGVFNGFIISRTGIPDFIMGLGMLSAARGLALIITGGLPISGLPKFLIFIGSTTLFGVVPMAAVMAFIMVLLAWFVLNYTHLGRCTFAIGGNKEAARAAGIDVKNTKVKIYAFLGFFVAIASWVQIGRIYSANALMGSGQELQAIAAVIIGGASLSGGEGSIFGTVIGALIMGIISNGLNLLNVSSFWQQFFIGSIIIIVVVIDQLRRRN